MGCFFSHGEKISPSRPSFFFLTRKKYPPRRAYMAISSKVLQYKWECCIMRPMFPIQDMHRITNIPLRGCEAISVGPRSYICELMKLYSWKDEVRLPFLNYLLFTSDVFVLHVWTVCCSEGGITAVVPPLFLWICIIARWFCNTILSVFKQKNIKLLHILLICTTFAPEENVERFE